MSFIRSVSGIRATLSDGLDPALISRYAIAFSNTAPAGEIFIGRDGRQSGEWIENIIAGALQSCGRKVIVLGIVPTPTVQFMVENNNAAGGIAITASHNPSEWNGMKFINSNGIFLNAEENKKLWQIVDSGEHKYHSTDDYKSLIRDHSAITRHIDSIADFPLFADNHVKRKCEQMRVKAVVDAVNASGSVAVPKLLEKFGVTVIKLYCDNNGNFPHTPEPLPENLSSLCDAVKKHKASIGIAVDPDADRLVLIDENGTPIGEEKTIAIAIMAAMEDFDKFSGYEKIAVVNHSTSMLAERAAALYGGTVKRSPVGEINVIAKMKEHNAVIGGEGSGGVILPDCHYGRDSLVGIALLLHLMTKLNMSLSQISAKLGTTNMIKTKIPVAGDINLIFDKIAKKYEGGNVIREDGIKVIFEDSWVQLRASNTEPIIRIIAEAEDKERADQLIEEISEILK